AMASRGRCGVPTRGDEQRREERVEPRREDQGEQQAPAPHGPVLPPPPLVDYGVFMQGLVQAMQTQAHTQAALQAQLEAQATCWRQHELVLMVSQRPHRWMPTPYWQPVMLTLVSQICCGFRSGNAPENIAPGLGNHSPMVA
ncbi:hypothetical protein Taro_031995, partial [Colocasia esculenta]|nr:hypothetical protein [Colocasia esculenta]